MRKNFLLILIITIIIIGFLYIKVNAENNTYLKKGAVMPERKVLIAYYSYSGNTKYIAEKIQKMTRGDLFEIKTVKTYPKNYNEVVEEAKKEKNSDYRPELQSKVKNINEYNIVFIGTPVWWYTMTPAVKSFITETDLKGKTIIPFCTHGGGGASSTFIDMAKLLPDSKVLKGIEIYERGNASTDKDINIWIENLDI